MQIAVAATPEVAIPTLDLLANSGNQLVGVITQPDRPSGRGLSLKPTPVAQWATRNRVPLYKPETQEELAQIVAKFDLVITIAFGVIIKESVLKLPKFGFINLHFSLLPRWRGAAPVQRAIESGDLSTGVTVFKLDKGVDTGPIYRQESIQISPLSTSESLLRDLSHLGAPAVLDAIAAISKGERPIAQKEEGATRAPKLSKEEGEIDWKLPADVIERKIRAFYPNPGSWTRWRSSVIRIEQALISAGMIGFPGELIVKEKELYICCGSQSLKILSLKPAGKSEMSATAWLNGAQPKPGERFE